MIKLLGIQVETYHKATVETYLTHTKKYGLVKC